MKKRGGYLFVRRRRRRRRRVFIRELTNRRLLHDDAVGSRHSPESPSCSNLNLRFTVKTTTLVRARQIFPPFLKLSLFVF